MAGQLIGLFVDGHPFEHTAPAEGSVSDALVLSRGQLARVSQLVASNPGATFLDEYYGGWIACLDPSSRPVETVERGGQPQLSSLRLTQVSLRTRRSCLGDLANRVNVQMDIEAGDDRPVYAQIRTRRYDIPGDWSEPRLSPVFDGRIAFQFSDGQAGQRFEVSVTLVDEAGRHSEPRSVFPMVPGMPRGGVYGGGFEAPAAPATEDARSERRSTGTVLGGGAIVAGAAFGVLALLCLCRRRRRAQYVRF